MGVDNKIAEAVECKDPMDTVLQSIDSLYLVRDTFFPLDPTIKKGRLDNLMRDLLVVLHDISSDCRKHPQRRAQWEYLRGKVLDVGPDYCKEAEEHLSKSVKLDPSMVDAWCCLGNCFWKKGDLTQAKNCFNIALSKGPNKKALQQLSMLERRIGKGSADEAETVEESILHAKQAVSLDIKDGQSWYTLGNAYLTSFFVSGAWDRNKLHQSLKAYQNAEKDEMASANPDLHFNSATGRLKAKRLSIILSSLSANASLGAYRQVSLEQLKEGFNKGMALQAKMLQAISHDNSVPLFYLLADRETNCFALSVYALRDGAIKEGITITLLEPFFHEVNVTWKDKVYRYNVIRVDLPQQLLLNGQPPLVQDAVCSTLQAENIPP
uniref:Tetratricopeptide repeat protein 5 OB fold domain-containing protein n=1 Tax=Physcomitrium patens TaxID=3218 RepID=A0A7I4FF64_PHYPA